MNTNNLKTTLDMLDAIKSELKALPDSVERTRAMQVMLSLLLHLEFQVKQEIRKVG